jgi:hypothetical protein
MTAHPLRRFGFARTDFGLPPPSLPSFLRAAAKQRDLPAWMQRADLFSSDAIIFFQDANGRHPPFLSSLATAHPAVSFGGQTVLFASNQKARNPKRQTYDRSHGALDRLRTEESAL